MDSLLSQFSIDASLASGMARLGEAATGAFLALTLVAARLTGMAALGPVFGHPAIPVRVRASLVFALSVVLTPALIGAGRAPISSAIAGPWDYAGLAIGELAVGFSLGLGVTIILSGLLLAGSLIDQQIGTSIASVFNPDMQTETSPLGMALHQVGLVVFLIAGGHQLMISALIDTFQAMPIGQAWVSADLIELVSRFVHQSLLLAVQVSAPVMAAMALVVLAMGILGHTIPQINMLLVGSPVRTLVGLALLGMALPAIGGSLEQTLLEAIERLRQTLIGSAVP